MQFERTDAAFNRIMNGNFSHGLAYWGSEGDRTHVRKAQYVARIKSGPEVERQSPGVDHEGGPVEETIPMYLMIADGDFWHDIQYNDLSVYPSVLSFDDVVAAPVAPGEFVISVRPTSIQGLNANIYPFAYKPGTEILEHVEFGDMVVLTDPNDTHSGEYRAGKVYSSDSMRVNSVGDIPDPAVDGAEHDPALYRLTPGDPTLVQVRLLGDFMSVERADGTTGLRIGLDHFVSGDPPAAGSLFSAFFDGTYTNLIVKTLVGISDFLDTGGAWEAIQEWYIIEQFGGSVTRTLPVCLYDLTLAYTLRTGYDLDPANVSLEFLDEFDRHQGSMPQAGFTVTEIPAIGPLPDEEISYRVVQKFRFERLEPWFGKIRIAFRDGSTNHISDVVLYRGDYTSPLSDDDETGLLKGQIVVESEIIPRGTIIPYIGGAVCPPGFTRIEGMGEEEDQISSGTPLFSPFGQVQDWFDEVELVTLDNGEKRTLVVMKAEFSRDSGQLSEPWQITGGWVEVIPFRYPPEYDAEGNPTERYTKLIQTRANIGDPMDEYFDTFQFIKTDVVPGCILEIRFTNRDPVFAVVSQIAQGDAIETIEELEPADPFSDSMILWHINPNKWSGKNRLLQDLGVYGQFKINTGKGNLIEFVGDFERPLLDAVDLNPMCYIWKSGVVAHGQSLEDMKWNKSLYPVKGFGGYGYLGGPHSHELKRGDAPVIPDVYWGTAEKKLLTKHTHGYMFGAVTIPRVRPVLLCQKM